MPNDKLDDLLRRHAASGDIITPDDNIDSHEKGHVVDKESITPAPVDPPILKPREFEPYLTDPDEVSTDVETDELDPLYDIDYGDNDEEEDLKAEEDAIRREREEMYAKAKKEHIPNAFQPPDEKDMNYNAEAIGFQSEKLAIVAQMVNRVVAKYHIISGEIPDVRELPDGRTVQKMHIMGELIDLYHNNGETVTPEFESLILNNWVLPNGRTAGEEIREKGFVGDVAPTHAETVNNNTPVQEIASEININVEPNTPVTVNVDDTIVSNLNKSRTINVNVREISTEDLQKRVIVNNSAEMGVIKPHETGINDQLLTLPRSAYRCVVSSINWFDFIKLTLTPKSASIADTELRKWSIIYKHIRNISIGEFESFTDFMKKTKYADRELLMWALLVATADPEEDIALRCGNSDCAKITSHKYRPASLIHYDDKLLPKHYMDYVNASGQSAIDLWKQNADNHTLYTLPSTGITVELRDPTVYEQIYEKIPQMDALYKRYKPDGKLEDGIDDNEYEFQMMLGMMLSISAVIIHKDGKDYRYDKWERIEEVITTALDNTDSAVLIKLTQVISERNQCFSFYIENVTCPHCGRLEERVPIDDISETLLSQLSRRLTNIEINLNDMELS